MVRANAAEQVLHDLREQIQSGRFPRGAKLPTEKELAQVYGVSSNTVREAIRGLTASHLVEVKHGSGAYVTGHLDEVISRSLRSIIQVGRIGIEDIFNTYGAFNGLAAELAARNATPELVRRLQQAEDAVTVAKSSITRAAAVVDFLDILSHASGNPLLATFCRFLARLQADIFRELSDASPKGKLQMPNFAEERQALVEAIRKRSPEAARAGARSYEVRALAFLMQLTGIKTTVDKDPVFQRLLTSLLQDRDVEA